MSKLINLLKSDIGKIFSGNLVIQGSTLLQAVILSRILGPQGKGEFIEIILWPTIVSGFSILGLYTGLAKLCAKDKLYNHWNFAKASLISTLIVGSLGTLLCMIISPQLVSNVGEIKKLAVFFSFFVIVNNVARGFIAIDHGRKQFTKYSITRAILNPIFLFLLSILYCFNAINLSTVIYSFFCANLLVALIRVFYSLRDESSKKSIFPIRKLFRYSLKYSVSDFSEPIYAYYDKAILALVLTSYDLGLYTTAYSSAGIITVISNVYGTKIFSDLASGTSPDSIMRALRYNSFLMIILSIGLSLLLPYLIPIVFGEKFEGAILPSIILTVTCLLQGESYIVERGLLGMGCPYAGVRAKIVSMITMAVACLGLGAMGFINIYVMIIITTICQLGYFLTLICAFKTSSGVGVSLIPTIEDIKYLLRRMI